MEDSSSLMWFAIILSPILVIILSIYSTLTADFKDLQENWTAYRCHPFYMPFANIIDSDVSSSENMFHCMNMFGAAVLEKALQPVYTVFGGFLGILGETVGTTGVLRNIIVKISTVILTVVNSMFGKIFNSMNALTMMLVKVRNINSRIIGSAWYTAMIAETSVSFIQSVFGLTMKLVRVLVYAMMVIAVIMSLFYPPLFAFAVNLGSSIGVNISVCFDPDTEIETINKGKIPIKRVEISDRIAKGSKVLGKFTFSSKGAEMYDLDGIVVSGYHKVNYNGRIIHVKEHPYAKRVEYTKPEIICLITHDHTINIRGKSSEIHHFADYEEDTSDEVQYEIERITFGRVVKARSPPAIHPNTFVNMYGNEVEGIHFLRIGERIQDGSAISGIVTIHSSLIEWVTLPGDVIVSESQPIRLDSGIVILARDVIGARKWEGSSIGMQIFVDSGYMELVSEGNRIMLYNARDYVESHDQSILLKLEDIVLNHMNEKLR